MAVDEVLLDFVAAGQSPPTLRFYGWSPPALSLGRFQDASSGIALSLCRERGWEIVRRPTGGRAVLHDREITFSIVFPLGLVDFVGVMPSYCMLSRAISAALAGVGVCRSAEDRSDRCRGGTGDPPPPGPPLPKSGEGGQGGEDQPRRSRGGEGSSCFAATLAPDSGVGGRKLVGAAQVRRGGALLQHGSLLLAVDRSLLAALFGEVGPVVSLSELVTELPPREALVDRLAVGLAGALEITLEAGELTGAEEKEVAMRLESGERGGTRSPGRRAALDSA